MFTTEKTKAEKKRADEQTVLAQAAAATARDETDKTRKSNLQLASANLQLEDNKSLLNKTLQGTIAVEASDYEEAKTIFEDVKNINSCGNSSDIECQKLKIFNDWWAHHNIATSSFHLAQFKPAESNFILALNKLEEYERLITKNINFYQPSSGFIINASYKQTPTKEQTDLNRRKIMTLRKFAQFYRTCGKEPKRCFGDSVGYDLAPATGDEDLNPYIEKPLSEKAKEYYPKAIDLYEKKLLKVSSLENPTTLKDRIYKAEVENELADIYKDNKNYKSAKDYYQSSMANYKYAATEYGIAGSRDYKSDSVSLSEKKTALLKNLLEVTIRQTFRDKNNVEDNLKFTDKLLAEIISETEKSLPEAETKNPDILYNLKIGNTYAELANILIYISSAESYSSQEGEEPDDNELKKDQDNTEQKKADDSSTEQKVIYAEFYAKSTPLNAIGYVIQFINIKSDEKNQRYYADTGLHFGTVMKLAISYIDNKECSKTYKLIPKMEELLNNQHQLSSNEANEKGTENTENESIETRLTNLFNYAKFYENNLYDYDRAAVEYDKWVKAYNENLSGKTSLSNESNSIKSNNLSSNLIEIGKFYYLHGNYAKAQELFNAYNNFAETNETGNSDFTDKTRISLNKLYLNILTAQANELGGNKNKAVEAYKTQLETVQNWIRDRKELEKAEIPKSTNANRISKPNANTPANSNVIIANSNVSSNMVLATSSNKVASGYTTPYALGIMYKEAGLYEAFLRIRLAALNYEANNIAEAEKLLNDKVKLSIPFGIYKFPAFTIQGYVSGIKTIVKNKPPDSEQYDLYYQNVIGVLELSWNNDEYEPYSRHKTLSKEFYTDYFEALTALNKPETRTPEFLAKLEYARISMESSKTIKELEEITVCQD